MENRIDHDMRPSNQLFLLFESVRASVCQGPDRIPSPASSPALTGKPKNTALCRLLVYAQIESKDASSLVCSDCDTAGNVVNRWVHGSRMSRSVDDVVQKEGRILRILRRVYVPLHWEVGGGPMFNMNVGQPMVEQGAAHRYWRLEQCDELLERWSKAR